MTLSHSQASVSPPSEPMVGQELVGQELVAGSCLVLANQRGWWGLGPTVWDVSRLPLGLLQKPQTSSFLPPKVRTEALGRGSVSLETLEFCRFLGPVAGDLGRGWGWQSQGQAQRPSAEAEAGGEGVNGSPLYYFSLLWR